MKKWITYLITHQMSVRRILPIVINQQRLCHRTPCGVSVYSAPKIPRTCIYQLNNTRQYVGVSSETKCQNPSHFSEHINCGVLKRLIWPANGEQKNYASINELLHTMTGHVGENIARLKMYHPQPAFHYHACITKLIQQIFTDMNVDGLETLQGDGSISGFLRALQNNAYKIKFTHKNGQIHDRIEIWDADTPLVKIMMDRYDTTISSMTVEIWTTNKRMPNPSIAEVLAGRSDEASSNLAFSAYYHGIGTTDIYDHVRGLEYKYLNDKPVQCFLHRNGVVEEYPMDNLTNQPILPRTAPRD